MKAINAGNFVEKIYKREKAKFWKQMWEVNLKLLEAISSDTSWIHSQVKNTPSFSRARETGAWASGLVWAAMS